MGDVIKIGEKDTPLKRVKRLFADIDPHCLEATKEAIILEARVLIGLDKAGDAELCGYEPVAFDDIWDIWEEANEHCYFCSDSVDPLEEGYGETRGLCPICARKMRRYMESIGKKGKDINKSLRVADRKLKGFSQTRSPIKGRKR